MRDLEDLERAFERGLNAWEQEIVAKHAKKIGQKIVREVKRETKVVTGNLRRRWTSDVTIGLGDVQITIANDAEYAAAVNDGRRIIRGGKTVGKTAGRHMLETGLQTYQDTYLKQDLEDMVNELGGKIQ